MTVRNLGVTMPSKLPVNTTIGVFVIALVLAVVAHLGIKTGANAGADPLPVRPRLLVIGDSIILGTQNNIAANLPDWDVTFDAEVSRSTAAGLDALHTHGTDYSVVVIALGANDGSEPGIFAPRVAALLDALADIPHAIWVTIHEVRPYYAATNAVIRDQVARHPNALVGDWNGAIRPGDTGQDGLHLTGQGSQAMAAWIAELVRFVSIPPTTTTTTTTSTTTIPETLIPETTLPPATTITTTTSMAAPHMTGPPVVGPPGASRHTSPSRVAQVVPWTVLGAMVLLVFGGWFDTRRR